MISECRRQFRARAILGMMEVNDKTIRHMSKKSGRDEMTAMEMQSERSSTKGQRRRCRAREAAQKHSDTDAEQKKQYK